MSRLIVLDTETTGLEVSDGHRIIEIGAVELIERRLTGNNFHHYVQPQRLVDVGAFEVHGISDQALEGKPLFTEILHEFIEYINGATLIIHNAPFDVGFLNSEFKLANYEHKIASHCEVVDSLKLARKMFPGKRNTLDALCDRLDINNSRRTLHGALLDSEILADVFLQMTGGQETMNFDDNAANGEEIGRSRQSKIRKGPFPVHQASIEENNAHRRFLETIAAKCKDGAHWPS